MRESKYRSYDDLPLMLSAPEVAEVLGISKSRRRVDGSWGKNNVYILLSLDNPEVYRELKPAEELPFDMHDELPL